MLLFCPEPIQFFLLKWYQGKKPFFVQFWVQSSQWRFQFSTRVFIHLFFLSKLISLPNLTWFAATYLNSLRRSVGRRGYLSVAAFPKPVIETQHEITDYPRVLHGCCASRPYHSFPPSSQAFFGGSFRLGTVPVVLLASGGSIRQSRGSFLGCGAAKYINHFSEPLHCHGTSVLPAVMKWNRGQEEGTSS